MAKAKSSKTILSDHKRVRSKFIPPFVEAIGPLQEVSYVKDVIPELLWIAKLIDVYGETDGTRLALLLAEAAAKTDTASNFGLCSAYSSLVKSSIRDIVNILLPTDREKLSLALAGVLVLYPELPVGFIVKKTHLTEIQKDRETRNLCELFWRLIDRNSREAIMMLGGAMYIGFVTNKVVASHGTSLANFPELENYPTTEESKRVASSVRAGVQLLVGLPNAAQAHGEFVRYFWNQGKRISPCAIWVDEE